MGTPHEVRPLMESSQYQGKRLSALDVQRLYTAGERNFRGALLRGGNFRGVDLSGADFSGADLRSAKFDDATLQQVTFSQAQAGLQRRWWVGQIVLIVAIAAIAGFLQGFAGALLSYLLVTGSGEDLFGAIAGAIVVIAVFGAILHQGFTLRALGTVAIAGVTAGLMAGLIAGAGAVAGTGAGAVAAAVAVVFSVILVGAAAIALAVAMVVAIAFGMAFAGAAAIALADTEPLTGAVSGGLAVALAIATLLLALQIQRRIRRGDPAFAPLAPIGPAFVALGGTSFRGADLTGAYFTQANLKSADFIDSRQRSTRVAQVRWHQAQAIDRARLGGTPLQDARLRLLLTSLDGADQDFTGADLRSSNLAGAKLHRARLTGAKLNGANLQLAELHSALLTEANCIGTDFTGAQFTGACLEAWNIDSTTLLKDIDCQYVFLREQPDERGDRERRPHDPNKDFQPGDFEKFFQEVLDEVRILIRNGVHSAAFSKAFQSIMAEYPAIDRESVRSIAKQGDDVLLTLQVPPGTDKASLERTWHETYQARLEAVRATALLETEKRRADDLKEVHLTTVSSIGSLLSNLTIQNTAMTHSNNPTVTTGDGSFYAGGEVSLSGSTLNLGQISGQVTNQINQLPEAAPGDQPSLRAILTQLKTAIEADGELSTDEKAEALGAVSRLATAATATGPSARTQGMVKRATTTLTDLAATVTDASHLATACQRLLPRLATLME